GADVLQAVLAGDAVALAEGMSNDLQPAALRLRPELGDVLEFGESHGALTGIISGSGPTCAFLVQNALAAAELRSAFERRGIDAIAVTGPSTGARILVK